MRSLRRFLKWILPILGMMVILYGLVGMQTLSAQLTAIILGALCTLLSAWNCYHTFFPNERRDTAFRQEVDDFLHLVRQLYRVSRSGETDSEAISQCVEAMHTSVERMKRVAGRQGDMTDQYESEKVATARRDRH